MRILKPRPKKGPLCPFVRRLVYGGFPLIIGASECGKMRSLLIERRMMKVVALVILVGISLFFGTLGCVAAPREIPNGVTTTPADQATRWVERRKTKFLQAQRQHDTVFIGDSITHNWDSVAPDLLKAYFGDVVNLGFGGDRTQDTLWNIEHLDWQCLAPKRIMLMIGTNNTGWAKDSPEATFDGIELILRKLRQACPEAKITLLALFPRDKPNQAYAPSRTTASIASSPGWRTRSTFSSATSTPISSRRMAKHSPPSCSPIASTPIAPVIAFGPLPSPMTS